MDKRERILARLLQIAAGVEGVNKAWRNRGRLSETARPAIVILDADETAEETDPAGRPSNSPRRVVMTPEQYLLLSDTPENVGAAINLMRSRYLYAVLTDATLRAIVGTTGEIRYEGCATGLAEGRSMEGEMGVSISFRYAMKVTDPDVTA
jgi:hypothetical protein